MRVYLRYDLVGQQPDEARAFQPAETAEFQTGGSAFSSSAVAIPLHWNLAPMAWVSAEVIMNARTPNCAARIRRYEWVKENDVWTVKNDYTPVMQPNVLNAPRAIGHYIKDLWHKPAPTGAYYVLETKGRPVIFSAYIHGVTE